MIPALHEIRVLRDQRYAQNDAYRQQLFKYLTSECSLFSRVSGEVKATAAELDALITQGGSLSETLRLLRELDAAQCKFDSMSELIPAVTHDTDASAKQRQTTSQAAAHRQRFEVLSYLSSVSVGQRVGLL